MNMYAHQSMTSELLMAVLCFAFPLAFGHVS